jgi:hypothetical protein
MIQTLEDFERKIRMEWEQYNRVIASDKSYRSFTEKEMIERIAKNLTFWTMKKTEYQKPIDKMSPLDHQIGFFLSHSYQDAYEKATKYPDLTKLVYDRVQELLSFHTSHHSSKENHLVEQVVEKFVGINNFGNCLLSSIVLHELFLKHNIKSTIVKGYKHNLKNKWGYLHFWVKCENGHEYDVAETINYRVFRKTGQDIPDGAFENEINVLELPSNVERIDMETETERQTTCDLNKHFSLYLEDPSQYWSEAPTQMKNLRDAVLCTNILTKKEILDSFDVPERKPRQMNKKQKKKQKKKY